MPLQLISRILSGFSEILPDVIEFENPYEYIKSDLQETKQKIANITTQKKRIEIEKGRLERHIEKHKEKREKALDEERRKLIRESERKIQQKQSLLQEMEDQLHQISAIQDDLVEKRNWLENRMQELRAKKGSMDAVSEAKMGIGSEDISANSKTDLLSSGGEIRLAIERVNKFENNYADSFEFFRSEFEEKVSAIETTTSEEIGAMAETDETQKGVQEGDKTRTDEFIEEADQ